MLFSQEILVIAGKYCEFCELIEYHLLGSVFLQPSYARLPCPSIYERKKIKKQTK